MEQIFVGINKHLLCQQERRNKNNKRMNESKDSTEGNTQEKKFEKKPTISNKVSKIKCLKGL